MSLEKKKYIVIINYDCGNINSIYRVLRSLKKNVIITNKLEVIKNSKLIVLPGVGSYKKAIDSLKKKKIYNFLQKTKVPIFGICLGMQILSTIGNEGGIVSGLKKVNGRVEKNRKNFNIGWLPIFFKNNNKFKFLKKYNKKCFYFNHGYKFLTEDKNVVFSTNLEGEKVNSVIYKNNIFGVQFHPEKSQTIGKEFFQDILFFYNL